MKSIRFIAGLACMMLATGAVLAQAFPNKPLRVLVGYAAGGPSDLVTRMVVQDMSARLGQQIVAENRTGASGMIALDALLASPADGYSIYQLATPTVVASVLASRAVDPVASFAPLGFFYDSSIQIEINPDAPLMSNVRTIKDLLDVARANPGKINFTSAGAGSTGHLFGVRLGMAGGVQWTHVGYKGLAPAALDVMAGRVQMVVGTVGNDEQLIREGKIRMLAVTGAVRDPRYPSIPSIADAGYGGIAVTTWAGLIMRAGTPADAVERLTAELRTTMLKPDIQARVATMTGIPRIATAQEFGTRIANDYQNFARIIKEGNIKID